MENDAEFKDIQAALGEDGPAGETQQQSQQQEQNNEQRSGSQAQAEAEKEVITFDTEGTEDVNKAPDAAKPPKEQGDFEAKLSETFGMDANTLRETLQQAQNWKEKAEAEAFQSPKGKAFDSLVSRGIPEDVALRYISSDAKDLDDLNFMALDFQLENSTPENPVSADDAKRYIERKYKIGQYKADDDSEKDGLFDLKMDAGKRRPEFATTKEKMLAPFVSRSAVTQQQEAANRVKSWDPEVPKLVEGLKTLTIGVGKTEKGKPLFNFKVNVSDTEVLAKEAKEIIGAMPDLLNNDEGRKMLQSILRDRAIVHNQATIAEKAWKLGKSKTTEQWDQILTNTDLGRNNEKEIDYGNRSDMSEDDAIVRAIESAQS